MTSETHRTAMNAPIQRDRRTHEMRDAEVLTMIARERGFSLMWLVSNRDHAASLHRLIASGALSAAGSGWIRCEMDNAPSFWARARMFLRGEAK